MLSYKVELKVLSAVHIGAGNNFDILKTDYIKLPNQTKLILIDEKRLFALLCERGLAEEYYNFIENAKGSESSLYNFLVNQCKFSEKEINEIITEIEKYKLDFNEGRFYGIKSFVKDKSTGQAYIPASSIKGLISTAVYAYLKSKKDENIKEELKKIMKHILISDSSLINSENLFVGSVVYVSPRKAKVLNQYYEMLKPGTVATFILTIQDKDVKFVESIQKILKAYTLSYERFYASSFNCNGVRLAVPEENAIKCFLGAKTGFPTKTYYYQVDPKNAPQTISSILDRQFRRLEGKHKNALGKSPSCIKCINLNNQNIENGAIQLKFKQVEGV